MTLEQFRQRLLDGYDPDDLVNELGISTERLLVVLADDIEDYWRKEYEEEDEEKEN